MPFTPVETFWGVEHLRLALWRKLFKVPQNHFIAAIESTAQTSNIRVSVPIDNSGNEQACERCGFAIVEADYEGWQVQMCSALPLFKLDNPAFRQWLTTLSSIDCQQHQFEPILHD